MLGVCLLTVYQLKKLINKVVGELASLGLSPSVLQTLLRSDEATIFSSVTGAGSNKGKERAFGERSGEFISSEIPLTDDDRHDVSPGPRSPRTKAVYEVVRDGEHIHPRLRIQVATPESPREEDGAGADAGDVSAPVNIFVNALDSAPVDEGHAYAVEDKDLMLVTRPIIARPGQSLIWTLQRRTLDIQTEGDIIPLAHGGDDTRVGAVPPYAHPIEIVRRQ